MPIVFHRRGSCFEKCEALMRKPNDIAKPRNEIYFQLHIPLQSSKRFLTDTVGEHTTVIRK